MKIIFKIFHESSKPPSAEIAIKRMLKHNNSSAKIKSTEKYLDKGCLSISESEVRAENWESFIFTVLELAQTFGLSWQISGNISEELSISTNRFHAGVGVTLATIDILKENYNLKAD